MNAPAYQARSNKTRSRKDRLFLMTCLIAAMTAVLSLAVLLTAIIAQGAGYLSTEFLTTGPSRNPGESGIKPAMVGTILICAICASGAIPVGVATAILLEEYRPKARVLRWLHGIVQTNITNLAGVPSIVYGILGVTAFASMFNIAGTSLTPDYTLGQSWFDQYAGADGRAYFAPVDHRETPPTPAFARDTAQAHPFEIRRPSETRTDPETGVTEIAEDVLIFGDLTAEQPPRARLVAADNAWTLTPADDTDLPETIAPGDQVRFGFAPYVPSVFTVASTDGGRIVLHGRPLTRVLRKPKGEEVDIQILAPDEVQPLEARVAAQVDAAEAVLDEAIGRSPRFDQAAAAATADAALEAATLAVEDPASFAEAWTQEAAAPASLRAMLVERLLAMDGLSGRDVGRARRSLVRDIRSAELTHQLGGVVMAGTNPVRVDHKNGWLSFPPYIQLPLGRGVLAGGLTLMLVVLPIVIVASQESLRAVPASLRHGSLALGGTKWQSISTIVLPAAVPGICTGAILAMSRAIGEAAPILILAGVVFINFLPANLMDGFTAMPLQIFNWTSRPQAEFHRVAAAGIIVLLAILLTFNALAVFIRLKFTKPMG